MLPRRDQGKAMRRRSKVGGKTGSARSYETATSKRSIARKTVPDAAQQRRMKARRPKYSPKSTRHNCSGFVRHLGCRSQVRIFLNTVIIRLVHKLTVLH